MNTSRMLQIDTGKPSYQLRGVEIIIFYNDNVTINNYATVQKALSSCGC
jgi:hypothetical protein